MIQLALTATEASVIEDIKEIGFGELHDLTMSKGGEIHPTDLSRRSHAFIQTMRRYGQAKKVAIFDGEPGWLEVETTTSNGRACTKRIKFA